MRKFWKDDEVKDLFNIVKEIRSHNKPISFAFVLHANKYNRHHNSVKNYYYFELKHIYNDTLRQKWLGININDFEYQQHNFFDDSQTKRMEQFIENNLKQGISVRESCNRLSCGDIKLMQRYQNKYYALKKNNREVLKQNNVINFGEQKQKYIKTLSDKDINSLFLGLVRLIKQEALKDVDISLKKECEFATSNYQKVLNLLKIKEMEVDKLKSINKTLNQKIDQLKRSTNTCDKQL